MDEIRFTDVDVRSLLTDADIPEIRATALRAQQSEVCDALALAITVLETIRDKTSNPWVKLGISVAIAAIKAYRDKNCG